MPSQTYAEFSNPKFSLLGTEIQFLAGPAEAAFDVGLIAGGIPVGAMAPLHAHTEPEVICILEGSLEVYRESDGWTHAVPGDVVIIPGSVKHALWNKGSVDLKSVLVTQPKLYQFFKEVCEPFPANHLPPNPEQLQKVMGATAAYGYWMASPEENAAIGLEIPKLF